MKICPCCGAKLEGAREGACAACGATPVGPPLARPEHELPSYVRAAAVASVGVMLFLSFAGATASELLRQESFSVSLLELLRAAEAAAWRLKWVAFPLSVAAAWVGLRACAGIGRDPARFVGLRAARAGSALALVVAVGMACLVAVTVPERLHRRELARRAADNAMLYRSDRALGEYRAKFGSYPASVADLRRISDPDCSLAELLTLMETGRYEPVTDLAAANVNAARASAGTRRRPRVRNASARGTDDLSGAGLPLTNYDLVLPGRDKILGTDDDVRIRDGLILEVKPRATPLPSAGNSNLL